MDRVNLLREASSATAVKFLEFTRAISKNSGIVVCIFEGEDEKYYSPRIGLLIGAVNWCRVSAGGRSKVLDLLQQIVTHPEYKKSRFACFVDRDFEHWFVNEYPRNLYVTPCYSIENLYISETCFKAVLSAEFEIYDFESDLRDYEYCLNVFHSVMKEFNSAVAQFNRWAKAHRIMERDGVASAKLNIQNVKTHNLAKIELTGVVPLYEFDDPASAFRDFPLMDIDADAMAEADKTLVEEHWNRDFRGKQQLDCFRSILQMLKDDRCAKIPRFFRRRSNVKLSLSKENCISDLSQYADTPECLKLFLRQFC